MMTGTMAKKKPRPKHAKPAPLAEPKNPWPARLKAIREELGRKAGRSRRITQAAAANLIRVSPRAWAAWELGEDTPSPPFALLIEMLESGKI
jgi:DNA-binding transcriptional regulator YiaG